MEEIRENVYGLLKKRFGADVDRIRSLNLEWDKAFGLFPKSLADDRFCGIHPSPTLLLLDNLYHRDVQVKIKRVI